MKIIKKRNNSIVGWHVITEENVWHIDPLDKKIVSSEYQRRKYLTILGREFKVLDYVYTRESNLVGDEVNQVGFKVIDDGGTINSK